jgi:glutamine synthetase
LKLEKIKIAVSDIDGVLRGKYIDGEKFESAKSKGLGFCNVIFGWDINDQTYGNNELTGYPDALLSLDLDTKRRIPWEDNTHFYLGDFSNDPTIKHICPRSLLRKIRKEALDFGVIPIAAKEFEWFNFYENSRSFAKKNFQNPKPITKGMFGYSITRLSQNNEYVQMLWEMLSHFDIPLEGLHTETGDGVYEAAIKHTDALEAADRAILFKSSVKEIANGFEIMPSFMAKWSADLPGCSGHIHQSLKDEKGTNLFFDSKGQKLSTLGESYLAGLLYCLPVVLPMYAPTVNSYKRLVPGSWAATTVSYGYDNRTTAFRPIPSGELSTRIETRVPGADANPYLSIAATLASGLYGIKNALKLDSRAIAGSAYASSGLPSLSSNLIDATRKMKESELAKSLFGEDFVNHFVMTREWEWSKYESAVTNWELKRYFEVI